MSHFSPRITASLDQEISGLLSLADSIASEFDKYQDLNEAVLILASSFGMGIQEKRLAGPMEEDRILTSLMSILSVLCIKYRRDWKDDLSP